jgi:hypothetical protein
MKKVTLEQINIKNVLDIGYEPDKDRYSVIEYNSSRREISKHTFNMIFLSFLKEKGYNE